MYFVAKPPKLEVGEVPRRLKLGVEAARHRLREVVVVLLRIPVVVAEAVQGAPRRALRTRMSFSLSLHISTGHKIFAGSRTFFVVLADLDALIDVLLLKCTSNDNKIVLSPSAKSYTLTKEYLLLPQKDSRAR